METVPANRAVSGLAFFVTQTLYRPRPLFVDPAAARVLLNSLQFFRVRKEADLYGFMIMPDHIHMITRPLEPITLPELMKRFKTFTAHELRQGPIWNKGYWSEVVADRSYLKQKLDYLHENPVRARLCADPEDWLWSSARAYAQSCFALIDPWWGFAS